MLYETDKELTKSFAEIAKEIIPGIVITRHEVKLKRKLPSPSQITPEVRVEGGIIFPELLIRNKLFISQTLEVFVIFWMHGDDEKIETIRSTLGSNIQERPSVAFTLDAERHSQVFMRFDKPLNGSVYYFDLDGLESFSVNEIGKGRPRAFDFLIKPNPDEIPDRYIVIHYCVRIDKFSEKRTTARIKNPDEKKNGKCEVQSGSVSNRTVIHGNVIAGQMLSGSSRAYDYRRATTSVVAADSPGFEVSPQNRNEEQSCIII